MKKEENYLPWLEIPKDLAKGEVAIKKAKEHLRNRFERFLKNAGCEKKEISELFKELSESNENMTNLKYWDNDGNKRIIVLKRKDIFS